MFWIDSKFISLISPQLQLYKVKSFNPFLANCRCYICGDSKKDLNKARAYLFTQKDKILYKCHNCGSVRSVKSLLKDLNIDMMREYDLEIFTEKYKNAPPSKEPEVSHVYMTTTPNAPLKEIKKISQLSSGHQAKKYIESRKIPYSQHFRIYYTPTFCKWTNSIIPDKFKVNSDTGKLNDEPRIVLPFFDKSGNMFGYQGRALNANAKTRYITIMVRGNFTKIFGLDQIDTSKRVYLFEGPIDSMFIPNSAAMAGSDIDINIFDKELTTVVFDNEPRNKEIVKKIHKLIENGWTVCLWPDTIVGKDINDMILAGLSPDTIKEIIDQNSYSGLNAKLKFVNWKKV